MNRKQCIFLLLATGQGICYLFLLSLGNLKQKIVLCEIGFFAAFILYCISLAVLKNSQASAKQTSAAHQTNADTISPSSKYQKFPLIIILAFALLFRSILWLSPPSLSDDIYRYVWEGKIFAAGINPFSHAPDDPVLKNYQDQAIFPNINHRDFATIYPPISLFIFRLCAQISPTIAAMNLTFTLFDFLIILVLVLTLHTLQMDVKRVAVYAWNPLVIMEFSGSGHLDSAGIFFLMLALYLFLKGKDIGSTIMLAFSFLVKFLPFIFLPFILFKRRVLNLMIFALIVLICYVPFLDAGTKLFDSLIAYSRDWVFNASIYNIFLWLVPAGNSARWVSAVLFIMCGTGLFFWYSGKPRQDKVQSIYCIGFIIVGLLLMLMPVVHPWYVCWIIPFLVIIPNRAWILLSGFVFLSYLVLRSYAETGIWQENMTVKIIEYVPFYCLLLYDWARSFKKRAGRVS